MIKAWDNFWVQVVLRLRRVMFKPDLCVADTVLIDLVDINANWNWNVFK